MFLRTLPVLSLLALSVLLTTVLATPNGVRPGDAGTQAARPAKSAEAAQREEKQVRDVRLTITPVAYSRKSYGYEAAATFKAGEKVIVRLTMLNTGDASLEVETGDGYLRHRLRLLKDGQPQHYRKGVVELMRAKDQAGSSLGGPRFTTTLTPNNPTEVESFDLERWFERLEPGHYELTLRRYSQWKGKPADSNTVSFDVVP
ncbi:MAG TPA: hypothetical protein VF659_12375 [Pyrinomonadaceae bacterium]|jgi:hypothetical protein